MNPVLILSLLINAIYGHECPNAVEGGSWQVMIPERGGGAVRKSLGMQTVHAALLPSGDVFLASGSSWRNRGSIETFLEAADL